MDIKREKGIIVDANPAECSDERSINFAQIIAETASVRDRKLPAFAGSVAIEGTTNEVEFEPLDVKEAIAGQLGTSFSGYSATVTEISKIRKDANEDVIVATSHETLTTEFFEWFDKAQQAYVAKAMEADPELRYTLIAKPNISVSSDEIIAAMRSFGVEQPFRTDVWPDMLKCYTPEELSGTDPDNGNNVMFSLVPNRYNSAMYGTTEHQVTTLAELQADNPFLRASRPLDYVVFLHTQRASDNKLVGTDIPELTHLRSFDMKPKRLGIGDCVPYLIVNEYGQVYVCRSRVSIDDYARVLVG